MGCGGVKNSRADSPRNHSGEQVDKLPAIVLEAFARLYGIPLKNPNSRSKPKPEVANRGKGLFEGVEERRNTVETMRKAAMDEGESVSPLPPAPMALSSSPSSPVPFQPPTYLDEAAQLAAVQHAAQERQAAEDLLAAQSLLIDKQKTQADAILSKYQPSTPT
jgi:hypothetical protein